MPSSFWLSAGVAALAAALLIQALLLRVMHDDQGALYKLFAVRDKLIRLVIEKKVSRYEPYFDVLYRELNLLLRSGRGISGPRSWPVATAQGKHLAHHPEIADRPVQMPANEIPEPLQSVTADLRTALVHLLRRHHGLYLQVSAERREADKIRRARARALLESMPVSIEQPAAHQR